VAALSQRHFLENLIAAFQTKLSFRIVAFKPNCHSE
jgi:hypothetical protein